MDFLFVMVDGHWGGWMGAHCFYFHYDYLCGWELEAEIFLRWTAIYIISQKLNSTAPIAWSSVTLKTSSESLSEIKWSRRQWRRNYDSTENIRFNFTRKKVEIIIMTRIVSSGQSPGLLQRDCGTWTSTNIHHIIVVIQDLPRLSLLVDWKLLLKYLRWAQVWLKFHQPPAEQQTERHPRGFMVLGTAWLTLSTFVAVSSTSDLSHTHPRYWD